MDLPLNGSLVIATHNSGKLSEMRALMEPYPLELTSAGELGLEEPVEDGESFEANAAIKALAAARASGMHALSDDSGLCISALYGAPGIHTADWAEREDGSGRDFTMAMERVLRELNETEDNRRSAKFVAVLCLASPDGSTLAFRGEVHGVITSDLRGVSGFGYDPIFLPDEYTRTFGEMSAQEKHALDPDHPEGGLSHRARAFTRFARACLRTP